MAGLSRPSASFVRQPFQAWIPGTKPGMTVVNLLPRHLRRADAVAIELPVVLHGDMHAQQVAGSQPDLCPAGRGEEVLTDGERI